MAATIVIVDDQADKRFLLEWMLKKNFPKNPVVSFADCDAALETVAAPVPKVVITNGKIGFKDGIEFTSYLHHELHVPVVVVSLRGQLEKQAIDAGAFSFVETGDKKGIQKAMTDALRSIDTKETLH